ncbi:MAG TPA: flagellar basal body rod protein FlgB [Candidatus Blautia stercoravium]|nr:flagellar basal body rod protein FlgB [Candidatus Blautia stercoravium]
MFGNTIAMMDKSLDYLWKKQEVTANNIANVDTPGYKKKSVNFEDTFRRKLESAAATGKNEDVQQSIKSTQSRVVSDNTSVRADENGVNADVEYTELTRTALQYQYLSQSISADITRYRSAIKGQ